VDKLPGHGLASDATVSDADLSTIGTDVGKNPARLWIVGAGLDIHIELRRR